MWDDGPSVLDLVLISFLSFLLWAVERIWSPGEGVAETHLPEEKNARGGRKFLWSCRVDEGNAKIEIWKVQDSNSSRP